MLYKDNIIMIGASTGGPNVLYDIFSKLPPLNAAVVIIQHILAKFDAKFASGLNNAANMDVVLARNGNVLKKGTVFIAPAGVHLSLLQNTYIKVFHGEKVNYCCPSIDVAMMSLVNSFAGKIVGVILTGMGKDGANGVSHIKTINGYTIAQDKRSSAVYSMPLEAQKTGDVDFVLSSADIGRKLTELVGTIRR